MIPVLIVTIPDRVDAVQSAVTHFAHSKALFLISVVGLSPTTSNRIDVLTRSVIRNAESLIGKSNSTRCAIVVDSEVKCNLAVLAELFDSVERKSFSALRQTARHNRSKPYLEKYLSQKELTPITYGETIAKQWAHSTINSREINDWLEQFDILGYGWVGEKLLGRLELANLQSVGDSFCDSIIVHPSDALCVISDPETKGKSAEIISTILRKRFPNTKLGSDPGALIESGRSSTIHIVEDGLFTGTEMIGVFESLLDNRTKLHKRNKVRPLNDPSLLTGQKISLHFSICSDYGLELLKLYLEQKGLDATVAIFVPHHLQFGVLSNHGKELLAKKPDATSLWETGLSEGAISPFAFGDRHLWGMEKEAHQAEAICRSIGEQLFTRYIEAQVHLKGWDMWPAEKLQKCALGMWGLGLLHAFSHSVPKASLPVFWAGGDVELDGRKVNWKPLFPRAA